MSLVFDSANDFARLAVDDPWARAYPHGALSAAWKFKATAAAAGTLFAWRNVSTHHHRVLLGSDGASITLEQNNGTDGTTSALTGSVGTMISIGLRLTGDGSTTQTAKLYVKVGSATTQVVSITDPQKFDYLSEFWLGPSESGDAPPGEFADFKMWFASLSDAEFEDEFAQQAPKRTAGLMVYNDCAGGNIDAALANDTYAIAWAQTWGQVDSGGAAGTKPTLGSASATYSSVPTLSGSFTLPSTAPATETEISVIQSTGAPTLGTAPVSVSLPFPAGINNLLLVTLGGWLANATDAVGATIADNQPLGGLDWQKHLVKQRTPGGQDAWTIAWTAPVTRSVDPLTVTVTPAGATANGYYTVSLHELVRADISSSRIDGTPQTGSGSGTSGSISLTTTNAKDLLVAIASWLNSEGSATTPTNYTELFAKQGQGGLHVSARYVTATGSGYGPTWTFAQTGGGNVSWCGGVLAIKEQASQTAPSITTTSLPAATIDEPYVAQIAATGTGPLRFEVTSGSPPPWATVSESGLVTGSPTGAASSFAVVAIGPGGTSSPVTLSLGGGTAPDITSLGPFTFVVGQPVNIPLTATGTGPFTWSAAGLPAGLQLVGSSIIGALTAGGATSATIGVVGAAGSDSASVTITGVSKAGAPAITTTSLASATAGAAGTRTIAATGNPTITWSVPFSAASGVTINASGVLSYPALDAGSYAITVQATNSVDSVQRTFVLFVEPVEAEPVATRTWVGPDGGGVSWRKAR